MASEGNHLFFQHTLVNLNKVVTKPFKGQNTSKIVWDFYKFLGVKYTASKHVQGKHQVNVLQRKITKSQRHGSCEIAETI